MSVNRVDVRIAGQEFTITGDKSPDEMRKIANYVDDNIKMISKIMANGGSGNMGILCAVNIAEEYFDTLNKVEEAKAAKAKLENDSKYYLKMWEDAKKNYISYKENVTTISDKRKEDEDKIKELEARCNEYESSFFEIQMENVKLKREIEDLKK